MDYADYYYLWKTLWFSFGLLIGCLVGAGVMALVFASRMGKDEVVMYENERRRINEKV